MKSKALSAAQLCWTLLSVISDLPGSGAELLKLELAALAPSLCHLPLRGVILPLGRDGCNVLPGVSDHHLVGGPGRAVLQVGQQHLRVKVSPQRSHGQHR